MLQTVIDIAQGAGDILMHMRETGFKVMKKSDTGYTASDIVTEADLAADKYIREQLTKHFPGEQILTEETEKDCHIDRTQPCWIVDPLDGTNNFSKGLDLFGVLIGRVENGIPVLGVCYFPEQQKMFSAEKGRGAFCNNSPIYVSSNNEFIEGKVYEHIEYSDGIIHNTANNKQLPGFTSRGCTGRSLCDIAQGSLVGVCKTHPLSGKRDTCGPQIILEEAGGIVTDIHNETLDYTQESHFRKNGSVSSTKDNHMKVIDFLR